MKILKSFHIQIHSCKVIAVSKYWHRQIYRSHGGSTMKMISAFENIVNLVVSPLQKDGRRGKSFSFTNVNSKPVSSSHKFMRSSSISTFRSKIRQRNRLSKDLTDNIELTDSLRKESITLMKLNHVDSIDEDVSSVISDVSLSCCTAWYYGEMTIMYNSVSKNGSVITQDALGSLLVRVDRNYDVIYDITYNTDKDICTGVIPYKGGKYCLDFSDPQQPRFTSINLLLANLIERDYLQRVSFSWLIENSRL